MSALGDLTRAVAYYFGLRSAALSGFPEAERGPVDPMIHAQGSLPDWQLEQGWSRRYIVDRAQQMHRSNLLAGSLIERSTEHVIGPGFRLRVKTKDKGFNRESRLMWEEWANNPHLCDTRGRFTFMESLAQAYMGRMRDGDAFFLMREDGRVRTVHSIEVASPLGGYSRTTEADGIETDRDGKPIAYWIYEPEETPQSNIRAAIHRLMRVPAEHVVHVARIPLGATQTRGLSAFLGTFKILEQVDGTLIAIATKAQTAAKFAMVITKKSAMPSATFGASRGKNPLTQLADGTLTRLETDEDIKPVQSMDPNANALDLIKLLIRISGTRFGLSLATVTLDHSDHNFSNARASAIETNKGNEIRQLAMGRAASDVRTMKHLQWIREGRYRGAKEKTLMESLRHEWLYPARPLIDPLTERQADLLGLDMGTLTWDDIAARESKTAYELFSRQAAQRKLRARFKLPDVRSSLTREEAPMPEPNDSPDKRR